MSSSKNPTSDLPDPADAFPHYTAGLVCASGSYYAYSVLKNTRHAGVAAVLAGMYAAAGYLVQAGQKKTGYDLGTVASVGLLTYHAPKASMSNYTDPYAVTMTAVGVLGTPWNAMKSYFIRYPDMNNNKKGK